MASKRKKDRSPALAVVSAQSVSRTRRWFLRGGLLAAVLALSTAAALEWRRWEAQRAGGEGVRLARQGRFPDAEPKLRAALEYDPDNTELLRRLALGRLGTEKLAEADSVLTHWCQVRPEEAEPYRLRMALNHHRAQQAMPGAAQQRLEELALADGQRVIELDPADGSTAQKVIWLCLLSGRFEEADRVCRRSLERQPDDPDLLYLQARVCHARGAKAEARDLLEKLLSRRPQFAPGLLLLAVLHYEADEAEQAIPLLRQVIAEGSDSHKEARYHLSLALARAGQTEEARRVIAGIQLENITNETSQSIVRDSLAVRVRRAELLFDSGQAEEALALLRAALRDDPEYAAAHRLLAAYYDRQGESAKGAEHRRKQDSGERGALAP